MAAYLLELLGWLLVLGFLLKLWLDRLAINRNRPIAVPTTPGRLRTFLVVIFNAILIKASFQLVLFLIKHLPMPLHKLFVLNRTFLSRTQVWRWPACCFLRVYWGAGRLKSDNFMVVVWRHVSSSNWLRHELLVVNKWASIL